MGTSAVFYVYYIQNKNFLFLSYFAFFKTNILNEGAIHAILRFAKYNPNEHATRAILHFEVLWRNGVIHSMRYFFVFGKK